MALNEKTRVALSSVVAAVFLTGSKLAIGLLTGSLGILSEAAHSGLDLLAAVMTWWAVTVSERPADREHTYGHEKIENVSALFETLLLLVTCVWIIYEAIQRLFFKASHVEVNAWSYGVVIVAIVVDFSRSRALSRVAKKTRSAALEADALHFSSDIWSSLVVLAGLVATQLGHPKADAVAALGVSAFVIWISIRLGLKAVHALTDRVSAGHRERAELAALGVAGVLAVHDVRIREAGAKHFVDLKVTLHRAASLEAAHEVTEAVENALKAAFKNADVLVHAEPGDGGGGGLGEEVALLAEAEGAKAHAVEIGRTEEGLQVESHLEWPGEMLLAEAHRRTTRVEEALAGSYPEVTSIRTHLECQGAPPMSQRDVTREAASTVRAIEALDRAGAVAVSCRKVRILEGGSRWRVTLDCTVPQDMTVQEAHDVATAVEAAVLDLDPRIATVGVHTEPDGPLEA
jgi:cation diffusion facilitator family transporter